MNIMPLEAAQSLTLSSTYYQYTIIVSMQISGVETTLVQLYLGF